MFFFPFIILLSLQVAIFITYDEYYVLNSKIILKKNFFSHFNNEIIN